MKVLCNECVVDFTENKIDMQKIVKIGSDAKLDTEDIKACLSALQFVFSSAAKFNTDSETLSNELQQLGLPKGRATSKVNAFIKTLNGSEHSSALCKVYSQNLDRLQEALKEQSLRLSRLNRIHYQIDTEFKGSSHIVRSPALCVTIESLRDHNKEETKFHLTHEKLSSLIFEIRQIIQLMDELSVH